MGVIQLPILMRSVRAAMPAWVIHGSGNGLEPLFLVIYLSVLFGFLVFGVIGIRSRIPSRAVGLLFLAPIATLNGKNTPAQSALSPTE